MHSRAAVDFFTEYERGFAACPWCSTIGASGTLVRTHDSPTASIGRRLDGIAVRPTKEGLDNPLSLADFILRSMLSTRQMALACQYVWYYISMTHQTSLAKTS